jgi:hypothetical protein
MMSGREMTVEELRTQVYRLAHVAKAQQNTIDAIVASIGKLLEVTQELAVKAGASREDIQ